MLKNILIILLLMLLTSLYSITVYSWWIEGNCRIYDQTDQGQL